MEAVVAAGLDGNRLKLALEPEAASVWCETGGVDAKIADPGTKFMVIDLGGGTADISVHEKKLDGTLKAIHKASGGPWGGVYVDANYIRFLERVFSRRAIADLKKKEMSDYFDVIREFETKKRCFSEKVKSKITFKISAATRTLSEKYTGQKLEQRIEYLGFGDSVVLKGGDKLRVEPDIVQAWFDDPINRLVVHLNNILCLPTMRAIQTVVLVGGFGESAYVQERLRAEIPVTRLFVPGEAGLVVLKGAVSFGHNPSIISSRVMNYTYGVAANIIYDEKIHSKDKRFLANDGHWRVHNGIAVYARVNTEVPEDQQITQEFIPNNYIVQIPIYRTTRENPLYVTESGCDLLAELKTSLPRGIPLSELRYKTTFMFGGTELVVKFRVKKTGQEEILKLNCLK
ncbi:HS12A-like protein [Mya arenaria]|uniref:HS12A-like protein n=1 Tax=Mya arenaria TaxID=6604 RepID=A0ABY7FW00_MYAAR|nr:HS12A-like protein [Mya arenaria]